MKVTDTLRKSQYVRRTYQPKGDIKQLRQAAEIFRFHELESSYLHFNISIFTQVSSIFFTRLTFSENHANI